MSPLHERHLALGGRMAAFGGWQMPIQYTGVVEEHTAVREAAGVFDVSHLGKAVVRGPGAAAFVDTALTNSLERIGVGKAQYTLCCDDATGGVVDDLIAYLRADDEVFLVPNAANTAEVVRRLTAAAPSGVEVVDQHRDFAVLAVQGRRSDEVLAAVGLPHGHGYMSFVDATWDRHAVTVCRTGYTGERGYELVVESPTPARSGMRSSRRARRTACGRAGWVLGTPCERRWATRSTARTSRWRSPLSRPGSAGRSAGRSRRSGAVRCCWPRRRPVPAVSCVVWRRSTAGSRARTCRCGDPMGRSSGR
jgi:glycine cleavage system aminomethyltransferase T